MKILPLTALERKNIHWSVCKKNKQVESSGKGLFNTALQHSFEFDRTKKRRLLTLNSRRGKSGGEFEWVRFEKHFPSISDSHSRQIDSSSFLFLL